MRKLKSQNHIIPTVIYCFDVMVSINEDYDQFGKSVIEKWDVDILDNFNKEQRINQQGLTYVFTSEKYLCCIIKINNFKKDAKGYATLSHECFHAAEFILRLCGVHLNDNSHEAYAYLLGYLIEQIHLNLK